MPPDFDVIVPATTRGLAAALASLEMFCDSRKVAPDVLRRGRIAVEELFTNTIKYGYGGECDRRVRVSGVVDRGLVLSIEDDAPPFDPTAWTPPPQLPGERPVGQAGISMVLGLCAAVTYARIGESNRVTMTIVPH
jgi:serine/threonine-protein kinase RsbW